MLKHARGHESRVQFARRLGLSYTFVRAMEQGLRFPSDRVLLEIAERLDLDPDDFLLAAWCDRSPGLDKVLRQRGIDLPDAEEEPQPEDQDHAEQAEVLNGGLNGHEHAAHNGHNGHA